MHITRFITIFIIVMPATICLADRQLPRSEILQILESLTAQENKTWIPAGAITATHEEYKNREQKESKLLSDVTVRFDGERFYWQIDAQPEHNLQQASEFDFYGNAKRIFVWDGQKYSTYYRPVNLAVVSDAERLKFTPAVNGPLTAGFIPWGLGIYSLQTLSSASACGMEKFSDNQKQIQLNLTLLDGTEMIFTLDPEKNYAASSFQYRDSANLITLNTYGNFQLVSNRWVPQTIMIEEYKNSITPQNLIASDLWNFTSISAGTTADDWFRINYENDALIEYHTILASESLIYRYYKPVSDSDKLCSDSLLLEKFDFDAQTGFSHNCASAAIKYTASKLGKTVTSEQLAALSQDLNGTSLYSMKELCENLGLSCRVVKTDIETLKNLRNCEAILHIPGKNHYIVLGNIDDAYVRIIDLSDRKFIEHFNISDFSDAWTEGIALIISIRPINLKIANIDNTVLKSIFGTGYSCNKLLQRRAYFSCTEPVGGYCGGTEMDLYERWGCTPDVSGTCTMYILARYAEAQCIRNLERPGECTIPDNEWKVHYMRACE